MQRVPPALLLAGRVVAPVPATRGAPLHVRLNRGDATTAQCAWTETFTPPAVGDHAAVAVLDDGTYWCFGIWPA